MSDHDLLSQILEQTRLTNGRVTACEKWIAGHAQQSEANLKALEAITQLVNRHEALVNKMVGAWIAASVIAAAVGTVCGVLVTYALGR